MDVGLQVDVAYFDYTKAFDSVYYDILLRKSAEVVCTIYLLQFFSATWNTDSSMWNIMGTNLNLITLGLA